MRERERKRKKTHSKEGVEEITEVDKDVCMNIRIFNLVDITQAAQHALP